MNLNIQIFSFFNSLAGQSDFWDKVFVFITDDFGYILLGFVVLVWILGFVKRKKTESNFEAKADLWRITKELAVIGITLCITVVLAEVLKKFIGEPRPFVTLPNVKLLVAENPYLSFPSLHAALYSTLAVCVFHYRKKFGIFLMISALVIAMSRLVVGVHFPVDILAGISLGILVAVYSRPKIEKIVEKISRFGV